MVSGGYVMGVEEKRMSIQYIKKNETADFSQGFLRGSQVFGLYAFDPSEKEDGEFRLVPAGHEVVPGKGVGDGLVGQILEVAAEGADEQYLSIQEVLDHGPREVVGAEDLDEAIGVLKGSW
jgi:hypothetical protein